MRSIINISIPNEKKKKELKLRAQKLGKSLSAYILYSTELEQQLIGEDEILKMTKQAEKNHANQQTQKLNSLEDLM